MNRGGYDVVVVGAGIHGAGVAQCAAASGYRVLVLEQYGPAAGTSSRSSKLIHGGLRYLETGQFPLVRQALAERETLLRIAPLLVRRLEFFVPVYRRETRRRPWELRLGLSLYAVLGGLGPQHRFRSLGRALWGGLGGLRTEGLAAVYSYLDAQTDDAALTRAVLGSARTFGAEVSCPAAFQKATRTGAGYSILYSSGTRQIECHGTVLVNAGGPWVGQVAERVHPPPPPLEIELVQGAHLHLDEPVLMGAFYVESPADRRPVFVMPWQGGTLVGTTETAFRGDPACVAASPAESEYLLETMRHYFPAYRGRVIGTMAGLRVLPHARAAPQDRSRETVLSVDRGDRPHYLAIYGGKLTTYRATAECVVQRVLPVLPGRRPVADTRNINL
ncbi:MAG: FAD-dependent oxidoreductase [Gammaproteobacteria bacterium]